MLDIIAGGQFGDEGKGSVCAWLVDKKAREGTPYAYAVRVGGSNAEHRFATPGGNIYTSRVLPTAAWLQRDLAIIIGPGHMISLEALQGEIETLVDIHGEGIKRDIYIDPLAGVIAPDHRKKGRDTVWRGSTHQGVGQAVAHKVARDGNFKTACDYPELRRYMAPTWEIIHQMNARERPGILEGSQGVLLSLNHGYYPYCTSKDTTPAAMLAEAGIPIHHVRDIYMVYRTLPMRVPGNSGATGGYEISWNCVEKALGITIPEGAKIQTDSGHTERIFTWSWQDFIHSVVISGPTRMVLTFVDWFSEDLMDGTLEGHIKGMEKIAGCPVVMTRHGAGWNDYTEYE